MIGKTIGKNFNQSLLKREIMKRIKHLKKNIRDETNEFLETKKIKEKLNRHKRRMIR